MNDRSKNVTDPNFLRCWMIGIETALIVLIAEMPREKFLAQFEAELEAAKAMLIPEPIPEAVIAGLQDCEGRIKTRLR